jgi:hypothetical protein
MFERPFARRGSLAVQSNQNVSQARRESAPEPGPPQGERQRDRSLRRGKDYADEGPWKLRVRDGVAASMS